ncbi:SDH family Clp fold serine proteinase [Nannocystis bainbridge]|uniref:SppA protein n=1 Tax=Nannocystis bainbridge TaxID=2995303 RepID=A0ABT5E244_9BACT|nr:hypothetical protein [Nannocystis bainbridge]MDC0719918.1 hypothetical protein [Nannocystis bainbridge]
MESEPSKTDKAEFAAEIEALAAALNADILVYSGDIEPGNEDTVIELCNRRARRPNILLLLATYGGDAHTAYRISRCLQQKYTQFFVLVTGRCKSAGTLLATGANELIMGDLAELGPLDVQMRKTDEIDERSSGLTPSQAMMSLDAQTVVAFQQHFLSLKEISLTTRTAAEIASSLVTGLYSGIYSQIEPMKVGEMQRALTVARVYGMRLQRNVKANPRADVLSLLVSAFPDHGYVIDREEARTLFERVREPSNEEMKIVKRLFGILREPAEPTQICFLNPQHQPELEESQDAKQKSDATDAGGSGEDFESDGATAEGSGATGAPNSATGRPGAGQADPVAAPAPLASSDDEEPANEV